MTKIIKFTELQDHVGIPIPAKKSIPSWYKKSPRFLEGDSKPSFFSKYEKNLSFKTCVPFADSMMAGYQAVLWQDVEVVNVEGGGPEFRWPLSPEVVAGRPDEGLDLFPVPAGHLDRQLVWNVPWSIETPPGYSVLITHPLNRFELPFTTLSGVVDTDSALFQGHLPFYLQKDWEGVIEKGTPLFQIIPFKRESWDSQNDPSLKERAEKRYYESMSKLIGHYKKNIWKKKSFN